MTAEPMLTLDNPARYAEVRRRYFTGTPLASTTVEVSRLFAPGVVVEVEVTAVAARDRHDPG